MERTPPPWDPSAMTQPIPVVPAPPPARHAESTPTSGVVPPRLETVVGPAAPSRAFAHRFGSIPVYLAARFAAFVLDIFGIGFVLATFAYHASDAGIFTIAGRDASGYASLAGYALGAAVLFAFVCEALFGTTLGKMLFALHVRRGDGGHAGALRIFVRYLLRPIDLLVVGPLLALVTPRHQRIGDFASGTVVSRSRIGAFASVLAVLAFAGIGYAQIAYGGGLTSAIAVLAETADFAPGLVTNATKAFGVPAIAPLTNVAPRAQASDVVATPAPIPSGAIQ